MIIAFDVKGEVHIYRGVPKEHLEKLLGELTREEYESHVLERTCEAVFTNHGKVSFKIIKEDEIPEDRTFRNAWGFDLEVNMDKAREIQKDVLRAERAPLLAALDIDFMRAAETKNIKEQERITAEKQRLRDITDLPAIEAASTPEELKEIKI